jgi:hypothetical protein
MTRRAAIAILTGTRAVQAAGATPPVPIRILFDTRLTGTTSIDRVWKPVWIETVRDLTRGGIPIESSHGPGEVKRTASGAPVFTGLVPGRVNIVVTARMPVNWDLGRGLSGATTLYEGHHLVVIPLDRAHRHQIPFLSVNTCLHELLHVLLQDVYERRPSGLTGEARELRVDAYATRLWLFGDGSAICEAARTYVARLRSQSPASSIG